MKKHWLLLLLATPFAIPLLGIGLTALGSFLNHNRILHNHQRAFGKIDHPPATSAIDSKAWVRHPIGNGGNCFYFVGELRKFEGDRANIEKFYAAHSEKIQNAEVKVDFLKNGTFKPFVPYGLDRIENWSTKNHEPTQQLYVVFLLAFDLEESILDFRCA